MPKITTVSGDNWDALALKHLGSEAFTSELINANRAHVLIVTFPAGVELTLPDVPEPVNTVLPPWKKG